MTPSLKTTPSTARLRIGLAHSSEETSDERDDVDFDAYIIRIVDEDGDVVSEGDDVATIQSSYKKPATRAALDPRPRWQQTAPPPILNTQNAGGTVPVWLERGPNVCDVDDKPAKRTIERVRSEQCPGRGR